MDADFNTARALGAIFTLIGAVNRFIQQTETNAAAVLAHAREALIETCGVLGIYNAQDSDVQDDSGEMLNHLVTLLLDIRQDARQRKDWETSDKIRDRMKELNIEIQDTRQGATWKFIS